MCHRLRYNLRQDQVEVLESSRAAFAERIVLPPRPNAAFQAFELPPQQMSKQLSNYVNISELRR